MAYGTPAGLIARFGQTEMVRLTTPADQPLGAIDADVVTRALEEASAMADSYIRKRYSTPMDIAPAEVIRAVADIARYDLSTGEQKTPSEDVRARYKAALEWLRDIADGRVTLDLLEVAAGVESYAMATDRADLTGAPNFPGPDTWWNSTP